MYKLQTKLAYFRFNIIVNIGELNVTWFVLDSDENLEQFGRCFTKEELDEFLNFAISRPNNFPNGKNYFGCNETDLPSCDIYSIIPSIKLTYPQNLILRKTPRLSKSGEIYSCMDIILTNNNRSDNHNYIIDFNVIGVIE